jgi:hypothetical protein
MIEQSEDNRLLHDVPARRVGPISVWLVLMRLRNHRRG